VIYPTSTCVWSAWWKPVHSLFQRIVLQVFGVLLTFLQVGQSEILLKHVFASLRSFIHKVLLLISLLFENYIFHE
jgi:fumarate reductase subunit D